MTALLWLRRDLRVRDHPALQAASRAQKLAVVFCLDRALLHGRHSSGARTQFLLDCLEDLSTSLVALGSRLIIGYGPPEDLLSSLATQIGASEVHVTGDVGPHARRHANHVETALARAGVRFCEHPGLFTVDRPQDLHTAAGTPYTIFTPYHRAWLRTPRRDLIPPPRSLPPTPEIVSSRIPRLEDLGLRQEVSDPAVGGEGTGSTVLDRLLTRASEYASSSQLPGVDSTSRLSPYLHFGCISALEVERCLPEGEGPDQLRRQLCWRDFFASVLFHFPQNSHHEHQPRYRGRLRFTDDRDGFEAWCQGRTGHPLVDAGMRQLLREGWMHNRVRMVVGSFLTKDLGIDWRWGERWFMRLLLDGDEASNNGNWQWIASVGVDPSPTARRIFNPTLQQRRFDPHGVYVRRYVPELQLVADRYLAEPWRMPPDMQIQARCVIGRDYPSPLVDHRQARRDALSRYAHPTGA